MKNMRKYYIIIWSVVFVLFHAISLLAVQMTIGFPVKYISFWIGYGFLTFELILHLIVSIFYFKDENKDKAFLRLPVVYIGFTTLVSCLVINIATMFIPVFQIILAIIINLIVLGFYVVSVVKAVAVTEYVSNVDEQIKASTQFIRLSTVNSKALMDSLTDSQLKKEAEKVYEAFRYSDPVSSDQLAGIENAIKEAYMSFDTAIRSGNEDLIKSTEANLLALIGQRNEYAKIYK